jgi:DNA polymerase/3'-5' exonuclease PolX
MSITETKRPLAHALADAEAFRDLFPAACYERWEFGGSIRRRKPEVSDVEHIVIPRLTLVGTGGLFDEKKIANLLWARSDDLLAAGCITKHIYVSDRGSSPRWGQRQRGCDFRGMNHEIFSADLDNWGSILACRTGPWERSKELVIGLQRHGYVNHKAYVRDKHHWTCPCGWTGDAPYVQRKMPAVDVAVCPGCSAVGKAEPNIVPCPTEEDFFRMAGFPYIQPEAR